MVRPTDLVALRLQLQNLVVTPGSPPRLRKTATGAAYLVVHFPPQAITEQTFFETKPKGTTKNPPPPPGVQDTPEPSDGGSEPLTGPPVKARISGESRLVFSVPDGFNVEYTLPGRADGHRESGAGGHRQRKGAGPGPRDDSFRGHLQFATREAVGDPARIPEQLRRAQPANRRRSG